ncbi:isocitrate lyase/PEP mutase family protein [Staphylococcus delphini]|uniref:isocitrate lyase/PEP mutase family protein n=1 Tax=Staphylococcus delphini TaxID=53344 RepID=UPI0023B23480|nr:isocitrate lyase/PEP mutase family protein [Staphylococcus delphini]MDE9828865.1 isocitrate lyase/PEP mutase family protein [Staphylococcus delphini]
MAYFIISSLKKNKTTKVLGVYDVISSVIAQESGFDAVWLSGLGLSTVNGVPDTSILTMSDILKVASDIAGKIEIPLIVDCDSGFGDHNNVKYLVESYERHGISGICIEDKLFPKKNSFLEQDSLEDMFVFATKIKMADKRRKSEDFLIIARIESLIVNLGIDNAISRAQIYVESGADAILILSKKEIMMKY